MQREYEAICAVGPQQAHCPYLAMAGDTDTFGHDSCGHHRGCRESVGRATTRECEVKIPYLVVERGANIFDYGSYEYHGKYQESLGRAWSA
eukprot:11187886-Lingulodinium_polyedra.AAC.1